MPKKQAFIFFALPLLFLVIYYQVFTATYFFSDDIHQLWYNKYSSALPASASQGRWISGWLFDVLFAKLSSIGQLRYLHILSLFGWIAVAILWHFVFVKWVRILRLEERLIILSDVFIVCCIPVAIYIGWASCIEMFIGAGAGLLSGHFLFVSLLEKSKPSFVAAILSIATGLISLSTYQNTFGMFLFPFFIYYVNRQKIKPGRIPVTGIVSYCLIIVFYLLIFKYYTSTTGLSQNDRVQLTTDIAGKLSFLFSDPLPMAFSLNLLYSARSIFSQVLAPLIMAAWIISIFIRFKKDKVYLNFLRVLIILGLLVLMYLPSMAVAENFASYRTLFVFNLAVFYLLMDQLLFFIKQTRAKQLAVYFICTFLILTGFYNFNFQFIIPIKTEYNAFSGFMKKNLNNNPDTVYFIRADRFMFSRHFHTLPYKDEFGMPSTNKDWVPEPLIKQYFFETAADSHLAQKIKVIQFADTAEYNNAGIRVSRNNLVLDMNKIFDGYMR